MNVSLEEISTWNKDDVIYVDTRGEIAYNHGHIDGAVALEKVADVEDKLPLDVTKKYVVYCTYGKSSKPIADELSDKGYDAYNLEGGFSLR